MKKPKFLPEKPEKCPKCGFSPMGTILYGMPAYSEELMRQEEEGSLIIGGCCIVVPSPTWECKKCKSQYFSEKDKDEFKLR